MKIASFDDHRVGIVIGDGIVDVTAVLPDFLAWLPAQRINWLIAHWHVLAGDIAAAAQRGQAVPADSVRLLPANPGTPQVYAAPANYRKHIGELGAQHSAAGGGGRSAREMGFFLKAPASLVGAGGAIRLPRGSTRRFDHESELAVIIGSTARNVPRERALQHVFGYACLIDATMRLEKGTHDEERTMRKSFDTFTPLGPWLVTADEVGDAGDLRNRLWVNDELRQDASTREMIVGIEELIEMVSSVLTLQPGDVIATGTPGGVGAMAPGDTVRIEIERVGTMSLRVTEQDDVAPRPY
jgi:2-keto-4-pentenoate hydratase/2-oxohepta-3-ene-1,7-dioic acid hydratase in catechol pathway